MRRMITAAMVAGSLAIVSTAAAQQRMSPEERAEKREQKIEEFLDRIEATDEQREQIRALHEELRAERLAVREENQAIRRELMGHWRSDEPNRERIQELIDRQVELYRESAERKADAALRMHELLDTEQRGEALRMMDERREMRREHRPRGHMQDPVREPRRLDPDRPD